MPAAYIPILFFAALTILLPAAWMAILRPRNAKPNNEAPATPSSESSMIVAEEVSVIASETAEGAIVEEIIIEKIAAELPPAPPAPESLDQSEASLFFLVAALFVIFSVAVILVLPWALRFRSWIEEGQGSTALFALLAFIAILLVGYAWLRKQRLFDEQPFDPSRRSS
jgi:NADH:ubiquinone oxidoreductase subunit 3 (subunit A)